MTKDQLEKWLEDEFEALEKDLEEGRITEKEYREYSKNLMADYRESLEEFK